MHVLIKINEKLYVIIYENKFVSSNQILSKNSEIKMLFFRRKVSICLSLRLVPEIIVSLNQ